MLNRYGLIDMDKILREQDALPPPGGEEPPADSGAEPPAPPDEPEEDPDDKIEKEKTKGRSTDLTAFRQKHADAIYRLVQAYKNYQQSGTNNQSYPDPTVDNRYSFNTQTQNLKGKFENAGIDSPYIAAFDTATTGLEGDAHIRFLTSVQGGRAGGRGRFLFQNPGSASEFADVAGQLRDDLVFEVTKGDPRVVTYKNAPEEPEEPEEPEKEEPEQKQATESPPSPVAPQQPPTLPAPRGN